MITNYILKNGVQISFDDVAKTYTLKAGATLLSVKQSLSPNLVAMRNANATMNADGTATTNVDLIFFEKSISSLASLVQGGSTNGKTWLSRNLTNGQTAPNQTQATNSQPNQNNAQNNVGIHSKSEAVKLWNDIENFVKDFGIEVAPRTMNSICFDNAPSDFIRNQMSLIGADDDLVKTAKNEFKQPEWKEILSKLSTVHPKEKINQRLEIFFGKQGTGKTYQAQKEYPNAVKISGKPNFDADTLFFEFNAKTLKRDIPTEITEAMINGKPIIIDEGNLFPKEVWSRLQPVLDGSKELTDFGNKIVIKDGFKIIVTMNLKVNGERFVLPEPIVDRASRIENFDEVKVEKLVENAWGF